MDVLLRECLEYFRARPVYRKLFGKIREKYISLGHLGGTVVLRGLSMEEKRQLGGFLQKDFTENQTVSVSASLMDKALKSSRFDSLSWEEILEGYYGETLIGKKERKRIEAEKCGEYFQKILENSTGESAVNWLSYVLEEHAEGYQTLMQQYNERPQELQMVLKNVMEAAEKLSTYREPFAVKHTETDDAKTEQKKELLPVFAAQITGNPHYFDEGTTAEKLLSAFLKWYLGDAVSVELSGAEFKKELLYRAGILKDELSNDVLSYGIHAWKNDGNVHAGIEGFVREGEILKLTLKTLGGLGDIRGEGNNVYIVENPAVFSSLVERYPQFTFVCGNGQPKLAVLILLDKLSEHHTLYYAGDFDPEGLQIATRLKLRYGERLKLWNYRVDLYEKYTSEVLLTDPRLHKLEKIHLPELQGIKEIMRRKKRAAYQEAMLGEYICE